MAYTKKNPSLSNQYTDTVLFQAFDNGIYDSTYPTDFSNVHTSGTEAGGSPGRASFFEYYVTSRVNAGNPATNNVFLSTTYEATNATVAGNGVVGLSSVLVYGRGGGTPVLANGNGHAAGVELYVRGSGNQENEHCALYGLLKYENTNAGSIGRGWLMDFNIQGAVGVQQGLLNGVNMFINNYYNGSPVDGSAGIVLTTLFNSGASTQGTNQTYPVDVGLAVVGNSGTSQAGQRQGWTRALQVGGHGGGWFESGSGNRSRIGTGLQIQDYETFGIEIKDRYTAATGPAMSVSANAGPVVLGKNTVEDTTTKLEVVGSGLSDPLASFKTTGTSAGILLDISSPDAETSYFVNGAANQFMSSSAAGDAGIKLWTAAKKFIIGGDAQTVQVTKEGNLGFYGVTPVARASAYTITNHTNSRSLNESAPPTATQLANVLGTLINDLKAVGLVN